MRHLAKADALLLGPSASSSTFATRLPHRRDFGILSYGQSYGQRREIVDSLGYFTLTYPPRVAPA